MLPLNLHHLYYFWTVAKEGSIAKACNTLFLSQPAISTQLKQLEKSLGRRLFDRHSRRLHLTADGELVRSYAEEIFSRSHELLDTLRDQPSTGKWAIQIGVMDQIPKQVSQALVKEIMRFHADSRITMHEGSFASMLAELRSHALDLIISDSDVPIGEGTEYVRREIGVLDAAWVASPRLLKGETSSKALGMLPLLVPTAGSPFRSEIERFLHRAQITPRVQAEVQDIALLRLMALDGLGVAPIHLAAVRNDLASGKLRQVGSRADHMIHPLWMLSRPRHRQNPIGEYLLKRFTWKPSRHSS